MKKLLACLFSFIFVFVFYNMEFVHAEKASQTFHSEVTALPTKFSNEYAFTATQTKLLADNVAQEPSTVAETPKANADGEKQAHQTNYFVLAIWLLFILILFILLIRSSGKQLK